MSGWVGEEESKRVYEKVGKWHEHAWRSWVVDPQVIVMTS